MENKSWFDPGQLVSILRHVGTALGSALGMLLFLGISQVDLAKITDALTMIGSGILQIIAGVSILIPVVMAAWAAKAASTQSKLESLNDNPEIHKVITVPGTAAAEDAAKIPGDKVV